MKKSITIILAAFSLLFTVSCADRLMEETAALKARIIELESMVSTINEYYSNTSKIVAALEDHDMIRSVTTVTMEGKDSYLINFVSGRTITLIQGVDGVAPNLGIRKYEDGRYYWTVQYGSEEPQWLLSSLGLKIRASGLSPMMKIEDGWWQYSYDSGATWIRLCQASGASGSAVFKNISVSDYFVTFTLSNNTVFQLPTEAFFNRVIDKCNSLTADLATTTLLLADIDTSLAVKSITQIVGEDGTSGYKLVLNNGEELNIFPGKDEQPFSFTIKMSYPEWVDCWAVKVGDGDYTWVLDAQGRKVMASSMSSTPRIGVKDTLDAYYYVYSVYPDIEDYQWLRDANGDLVAADAYANLTMFTAVGVGAENVTLTLVDGKKVYLPLYYATNPSITFSAPSSLHYDASTYLYSEVLANTSYSIGYAVANAPDNLQIDAIALDGATVTAITADTITFRTPAAFPANVTTTRVLVFMTWGGNVTMQVLEFKNHI